MGYNHGNLSLKARSLELVAKSEDLDSMTVNEVDVLHFDLLELKDDLSVIYEDRNLPKGFVDLDSTINKVVLWWHTKAHLRSDWG